MRKLVNVLVLASVLASGFTVMGGARAQTGHVLSVADVAVEEGSGNLPGLATVTINVSPAPDVGEVVKVDFGTSAQEAQGATATSSEAGDDTPVFPEDFAQTDGTVTFAATQASQTVSIPVSGDNAHEGNETFFFVLFNARGECVVPGTCETGASIGDARGTVTITDDDAMPTLAIDDLTHDEGNGEDPTFYDFTVTKSGGSGSGVTVDFATTDVSASAPSDYAARTGTLTFPASSPSGVETRSVRVAVNPDGEFEPSETFTVQLSNASGATISNAIGVGTIRNDDPAPPPSMTAHDATGAEGDVVPFVIELSSPPAPGQTAAVQWSLEATEGAGSATQGADFPDASGSVVFTAGETQRTVSVATTEDLIDELDESFVLKLTKPSQPGTGGYTYTIAQDLGAGTIADDDASPTLSIDDVNVEAEGPDGHASVATFTVTKQGLTDRDVTVGVSTEDDLATNPDDYTALETVLTFSPEETAKQATVTVHGDDLDEADEPFLVQLIEPVNATVLDGQGVGTIADDDDASATLSISDVKVTEGTGGAIAAALTVTKSGASGRTISARYSTANGTALKDADYTPAADELVFDADETSKTISVDVLGDKLDETTEVFYVNLFGAANASIVDGTGEVKVLDNDRRPDLSVSDGSVKELSNNSCNLTVKLSAVSGRTVSVHYATANGTAGSSDYLAKSGDLVFAPGESIKVVKIYARSDAAKEGTERFSVKLSGVNPTDSAGLLDPTGACSIIDND